jgi:hypothetical protein
MSNKTECLRCGGGLKKRFDHYECVDCHYPSDDFHFEQNEEIERLREALRLLLKRFKTSRVGYQKELEKMPSYNFENSVMYEMFMDAEQQAKQALKEK